MIVDNGWSAMRRAWHAVATSAEVGDEPVQTWLFGEPWVLVRLGGEVVAFADQCPHRLAPLSAGSRRGGELQCAYHGWRFDGRGACTAIPSLSSTDHLPPRAQLVPAAAATERYGLVWMSVDPPVADLHEFPEWERPGYDRAYTTLVRTPTGAAQLVDNFLDAAHFPYVHASTFGVAESAPVADRGTQRTGWFVENVFDTWYRNLDDPLVSTGEHDAVQPQVLLKRASASYTVYLRLEFPVTGATFSILFSCTPERPDVTRIYKLIARNDFGGDTELMEACITEEDRILVEDLGVLERYRDHGVSLDAGDEIHTRADRLSVAWRRMLAELPSAAKISA